LAERRAARFQNHIIAQRHIIALRHLTASFRSVGYGFGDGAGSAGKGSISSY
jgi:hypothetical protein